MENKRNRFQLLLETWKQFKKNRMAMVGLFILLIMAFLAIFSPILAPYDYAEQNLQNTLAAPSAEHWLGTDEFGRDVLSRILIGSRVSLMVGIVAVMISMVGGTFFGMMAAFYSKLDNPIMRFMDIFTGIPNLLMSVAIVSALGAGTFNLMIAVGISAMPAFTRVVRASVLTVKETEFIEAARAIGGNDFRIMFSHILPNAFAPILVQMTLRASSAIISAASLSFMGLGIQPPSPEWGCMLSEGRRFLRDHWHMTVVPGLAIMLTTYSLNLMGDGLRDALDPKLRR